MSIPHREHDSEDSRTVTEDHSENGEPAYAIPSAFHVPSAFTTQTSANVVIVPQRRWNPIANQSGDEDSPCEVYLVSHRIPEVRHERPPTEETLKKRKIDIEHKTNSFIKCRYTILFLAEKINRYQTAVPRQMQRIIPNMLQGEQQTIARRKVEEQLSMPTGELILGSDGSFFVRSRITNTILYEGTFSVYQPGTIVKFPNAARCTLSCQPIIYQPVYQPIYQPTNQPLQHTTTVYGNSQQPQMLQFGLPPNVQMIQPRVQQLPQQRQQQQQQQQQRHTRGVTENVIHIPQPQHVLPPAIHIPASLQQQIKQQSQTSRISPAVKITKPMEEEPTVKSPHEDIERGMSTGKHYQPISIDLSADDDDDRTVTAENSETEELPYGM